MIILTQAERDKFALWLEQESKQSELTRKLMIDNKMPTVLIQREGSEALAARIIATKLRQTESFDVL